VLGITGTSIDQGSDLVIGVEIADVGRPWVGLHQQLHRVWPDAPPLSFDQLTSFDSIRLLSTPI
jgi:hypothetical protein